MLDLWEICRGAQSVTPINGKLFRIVEDQEQVATSGYSDSMIEQDLLENMLEESKPKYSVQDFVPGMHYLLMTPFRYPPLEYGSRFGTTHESSIFYGSGNTNACLAECAYYRMVYWLSMDGGSRKVSLKSQHTIFSVRYKTDKGVRLHKEPFIDHKALLTDPEDYTVTQKLGSVMRDHVEAFEYLSARDQEQGVCIGLFTPKAISSNRPDTEEKWLCEVQPSSVRFKSITDNTIYSFPAELFLLESGRFPLPA